MDFIQKDLIEFILGLLVGGGISFHFIRKYYSKKINEITQKNGAFSKNNTQIGVINVRK